MISCTSRSCWYGLAVLLASLPCSLPAGEKDAITAAVAHLVTQPANVQPLWRYVWMQPRTGVTPIDVDLAMNTCLSKVRPLIRGIPVGGDVLAYRLDTFDPFEPERLIEALDSLSLRDPVFHVIEDLQQGEAKVKAAILAPHLRAYVAVNASGGEDKRLDQLAVELTQSSAPIFEARFLLNEILDRSYYLMRGVKVGDSFADVMGSRGFFFSTSKEQNGIRCNYVVRSGITGDQRVVASLFGTSSPTAAFITYDLFDDTIEPQKQFVRNLTDFNKVSDGSEIFTPMPNGMVEFFLADGEGKLVDVAPSNLATDTTKPRGHDTDLRPGLSCIACHSEADGVSMYRSVASDFETVPLAADPIARAQLDFLYGGDIDSPDGPIGRARRDYAVAVAPLAGDGEGAIEAMHQHLVGVIYAYRYELIDPAAAAIELGLPEGSIVADHLRLPDNAITDPEVAQAVAGVPLPRKSWNNIHIILASSLVIDQLEVDE